MILNPGEKVHVIHRQLYDGDARRHFVGVVESCEGTLARVSGHLFANDPRLNQFVKRDSLRTRIIPLDSAGVIINILPPHVQIEKIIYKAKPPAGFVVTDGSDWHLDLSHL